MPVRQQHITMLIFSDRFGGCFFNIFFNLLPYSCIWADKLKAILNIFWEKLKKNEKNPVLKINLIG